MSSLDRSLEQLRNRLARFDSLAIAFSGGVDSSVLLHAATEVLGEHAVGILADSPSLPRSERADAIAVAAAMGARLEILRTEELADERYVRNSGDRCFWCRHTLFTAMRAWAESRGFAALAYGEITDDLADDRPGRRAARAFEVVSPLCAAGFDKALVRAYAREHGLAVAEKPASACLASRVPVGTAVTAERLGRIERAEEAVRALGFRVLRVRDHGAKARVEVGEDELARARAFGPRLEDVLGELAFEAVELATYGSGR